jgi:predicted ester cyclase
MAAADQAIIKRLTDEAFLGGNLSVIDELISDDFVDHDAPPGVPPTKEGFRMIAEMVTTAFSDRKAEFDDYDDTSDGCVVESWAMTATHTGEAMGLAPSGQNVRVRGMELFRCANGKVFEHWGVVDMSDVAQKAMG